MMRHRKSEVKYAVVHGDPTIVEIVIALSGLLFGVFINYPFGPGSLSSIYNQLMIIAPAWVWSLIFVLASFFLTISPSVKFFHHIGILTTFFLWLFLFFVSLFNIVINQSTTLAPPAYFSLILFCGWAYLRRTGGLGESILYHRVYRDSATLDYVGHRINRSSRNEAETNRT